MPLFMDFHTIPDLTLEEVKKAHIADVTIQDKYQVKYHQFWVNEAAGSVFCLMEGPDKESCAAVHKEAHGDIACNIVEVESGFFNLVMGENHQLDHGLVLNAVGAIDNGYRFVLVVQIVGNIRNTGAVDYRDLVLPNKPRKLVIDNTLKFGGKQLKLPGQDSLIAVFSDADRALRCALAIRQGLLEKNTQLRDKEWDINFKIGLSGGQPLHEKDDFFESAINLGRRLSLIARNQEIVASHLLGNLSDIAVKIDQLRILNGTEEEFLEHFFEITEQQLPETGLSVQSLSREIGMSRPQLYRKITGITGRSPNRFIRELRMQKALSLIKEHQQNISQIALEVGFNNPSYFSKCFQDHYRIAPSQVVT